MKYLITTVSFKNEIKNRSTGVKWQTSEVQMHTTATCKTSASTCLCDGSEDAELPLIELGLLLEGLSN